MYVHTHGDLPRPAGCLPVPQSHRRWLERPLRHPGKMPLLGSVDFVVMFLTYSLAADADVSTPSETVSLETSCFATT